jgi:uncharacterized protein
MSQLTESGIKVEKIKEICDRFGAVDIAVFGSFVRGEAGPDSDIDLLITFPRGKSLFDLVGLEIALQEALHRKVDVVTRGGLSPHIGPRILAEAVPR